MSDFKVGDRVVVVSGDGRYFALGDTGVVEDANSNGALIQFDKTSPGFCMDGRWYAFSNEIKLIEPERKPDAQAEVRRRLEKIRKHLARIEELMSDKAPDDAQADAQESPWYPPVPEGFGPWIEYDGSGMPVDANDVTQVLQRIERMNQDFAPWQRFARYWNWAHNSPELLAKGQIVAYCVKK